MLGNKIKNDIKNLTKKSLEIENIDFEASNMAFFAIDEETNLLTVLKQSYTTDNFKDRILENLKNEQKDIDLVIESFKLYNGALDKFLENDVSGAFDLIKSANDLNKTDTDILNLKALLGMLLCGFSEAVESFYESMCYKNSILVLEYLAMLFSIEFNEFLVRYNHSMRFISEGSNQESIQILNNIIEENPEFIEPYVILILLYRQLKNESKEIYYTEKLVQIDKNNSIIKKEEILENKEDKKDDKTFMKNLLICSITGLILGSGFMGFKINSENRVSEAVIKREEDLTVKENLSIEKEKALNLREEELIKMELELKEIEASLNLEGSLLDDSIFELDEDIEDFIEEDIIDEEVQDFIDEEITEGNEVAEEETTDLDEVEIEKESIDLDSLSDQERKAKLEELNFDEATRLKEENNYSDAIILYKEVVSSGTRKRYICESMFEVARLSELTGKLDDSITYYKRFINTYPSDDELYDDVYYNLGMIYYEQGNLDDAKQIFYNLRYEVPNSPFYNDEVKAILSE
ncbi:MAG: tetratricopeptide repeat protein [Peptostreptococcaceae bacterium]